MQRKACASAAAVTSPRKPRLLLVVGYYYLTQPIYLALRRYLREFELRCYFPKDVIGSDINFKNFDRTQMSDDYSELAYDPPWFRSGSGGWYERSGLRR